MIRAGIDGRAFSSPAAGVRRYVANLVPSLLALEEPLEIVALGGAADAAPDSIEHVPEPLHPPTNVGWTLVGLPRAATRARVDLIHAPAYTAPFWAAVPVVLTIHDISYERHPEWYPYRRDWLRRAFYRRSAHAATHLLTDSEFSASEIQAAYGISRERMTIAPLGVSPRFALRDARSTCALPPGVAEPYVLHVGDLHARRNLDVVVDALCVARQRGGIPRDLTLVLAGIDRGLTDGLHRQASAAGAPGLIVELGGVSEGDLGTLYRRAVALVYPSLYEGFGLPVLEAMAYGTPVVASRASSIPEVLGQAGMLLEPRDVAAWSSAICEVVTSDAVRATMRDAGMARARDFTWERTARFTLSAYRQALGRP